MKNKITKEKDWEGTLKSIQRVQHIASLAIFSAATVGMGYVIASAVNAAPQGEGALWGLASGMVALLPIAGDVMSAKLVAQDISEMSAERQERKDRLEQEHQAILNEELEM